MAPPVLRGGGRIRARCARQDVAALCAATDSRSPGWQGHAQRPRRRTLVARGRRWHGGASLEDHESRAGRTSPPSPVASSNVAAGHTPSFSRRRDGAPRQAAGQTTLPASSRRSPQDLLRAAPSAPMTAPSPKRSCTNSAFAAMRETTGILGARRPGGQPRGPTPGQEHPENRDPPDLGPRDPREPRAVTVRRTSTYR